jgi:dephospho-CoA kinase
MSVDEKARHADFVIDNSGTEADVEERFVSVFAELMRLAQT